MEEVRKVLRYLNCFSQNPQNTVGRSVVNQPLNNTVPIEVVSQSLDNIAPIQGTQRTTSFIYNTNRFNKEKDSKQLSYYILPNNPPYNPTYLQHIQTRTCDSSRYVQVIPSVPLRTIPVRQPDPTLSPYYAQPYEPETLSSEQVLTFDPEYHPLTLTQQLRRDNQTLRRYLTGSRIPKQTLSTDL